MAIELFGRKASRDRETYGDRLPPGQKATEGWPVLTYGGVPQIDLAAWRFSVIGLVEEEKHFTWEEFSALPQTAIVSDVHCVTAWSKFDNEWRGVAFRELMKHVRANQEAQ